MSPTSANPTIRISSWKAFRFETELKIKPLTLLYGHNQAGKSTLLRLLPFLSDCLKVGIPGLDLQSPALRGATFKELGWMGPDPSYSPELTLIAEGIKSQPTFFVQYSDQNGPVPNRLELRHAKGEKKFEVSLDGLPTRNSKRLSARYAGKYRGEDWNGDISFDSLLPSGVPEQAQKIQDQVRSIFTKLDRVQWLQANRLSSSASQPSRPSQCCASDGADLVHCLQNNKPVLKEASDWFATQNEIGIEVAVGMDSTGRAAFEVRPPQGERLPLHLAGEGLHSLLPVLLCAEWADTKASDAPTMLAIEEPEAHLHPNMQIALMDRLIETAKKGVPVILETHSVYLLRTMQRAVLSGKFLPGDISLYWVAQIKGVAEAVPIEINKDATLTNWLPGEFEQEQELAREIMDLRWDKIRSQK